MRYYKVRQMLRKGYAYARILIAAGLLIGAFWGYRECWGSIDDKAVISESEATENTVAGDSVTESSLNYGSALTVAVQMKTGEIITEGLEEYVCGVVAAEMPANFEKEALKAQAVAARSYCLHYLGGKEYIPAGTAAQDWLSEEEQKARWGDNYEKYRAKIAAAVAETKGEVLYWQKSVITAAYHASCGGERTAAAAEVWQNEVPYFISVACPHGEEKYTAAEHVLTKKEIAQAFGKKEVRKLKLILSKSGRVQTVEIDGESIDAAKVRAALGLASNIFTMKDKGEEVVITTWGSGHGVGMCQYGAEYYAKKGWDYRKILAHYYPKTTLGEV